METVCSLSTDQHFILWRLSSQPLVTLKILSPHHVRSADFVGVCCTPLGVLTALPVYKDIILVRDYFGGG